MNLSSNRFVQSLGIAALTYVLLQLLAVSLNSIARIVESFCYWYRVVAMPHSLILAGAIGICYLFLSAVLNSRSSD